MAKQSLGHYFILCTQTCLEVSLDLQVKEARNSLFWSINFGCSLSLLSNVFLIT